MLLQVEQPKCLRGDNLRDWLQKTLAPHFPADSLHSIIPREWEAKGESRFFCSIDVDTPISVVDLIAREVKEHSRGDHHHFYADDVLAAAQGAGVVSGGWYWLYCTW
ncbi:hypothetical protein [Ottowia sp.]|uniref:hypothetical protein n=1 Tax=Ottowia sp. TaxID=1898956 RepID=UPI0025F01E07|nr:hypothetical protein [Ottowia sp.]MBK6616406.1 hypothetical protein [Ottowia sp.]